MMCPDGQSPTAISAQLVFGAIVIALGVLFTLDNLDLVNSGDFLRYWPVALIAIGAAKLAEARSRQGGLLGGALFMGIGAWLLLDNLAVIDVSFRDFWPLVLVIVGGAIVWQGIRGRRVRPGDGSDATISALAVLSGVNRGSNSASFRGGELTAFMGGCEIDLRKASIDGEATLDVFAMWGGIEIRVPENWTVIGRVTPLLGGFDDQTRPPQSATTQKLIVRGLVVMGGIEIKN